MADCGPGLQVRDNHMMQLGCRIMVVGSPGAGKTTLASELGRRLQLPVVHLDRHLYDSSWRAANPDEWRRRTEALLRADRWVIDGNDVPTLRPRLSRAQDVLLLDLPPALCASRVLRRWLRGAPSRAGVPPSAPPQMSPRFLIHVATWRTRRLPVVRQAIIESGARLTVLRGPAEVDALIAGLAAAAP